MTARRLFAGLIVFTACASAAAAWLSWITSDESGA